MILKGSQRGNGADLAIHLMNGFDNEHVEIAEVYGAVAGDLYGAFAEFEAVASGTKAKNNLYSLSINPSAPLTREQYHEAIQAIEYRLGLTDQPRAVVFHVKDGREHCHVVWSRIDVGTMRAIHMAHDRRKLMDLACELARKYGLDLPPGLRAWEEKRKLDRDTLEPSLAEKAQENATGISAENRRAEITACYEQSDTPESFRAALEQKGYVLAKGDRRGYVVVDRFGGVHSLTRYVKGHKASAIKARLASLRPAELPGVDEAKEIARRRAQAQDELRAEKLAKAGQARADVRRKAQDQLAASQARRRAALRDKQQEMLIRQQAERLSLHAAQASERKGLTFWLRKAVADLIARTPGLRSVLGHIQKHTHLDPRQRHALEDEALSRRHAREKRDLGRQDHMLSRLETRERQSLEKSLRRSEHLAATLDGTARQDFQAAADDPAARKQSGADERDLHVKFNDAAEFVEGAHRASDDDEGATGWKRRTERARRGQRPRRGKGRGYRRDSE